MSKVGSSRASIARETFKSQRPTMGSTRDWFPSRRSVANHRGGFSMVFEGHCRFGRSSGLNDLYFLDGSWSLQIDKLKKNIGHEKTINSRTYMGIMTHSD